MPIFPLPGAVLLPGGDLPLNIFEPRYLQMLADSLASHRLIGMIQPRHMESEQDLSLLSAAASPELYNVGCAGRITSFHESGDGPIQIVLSGICRFHVMQEIGSAKPYRTVEADYLPFATDLTDEFLNETDTERQDLLDSLDQFLKARSMRADWNEIVSAPTETLINTLVMIGSFSPREKQAVLEAADLRERTRTLVALTRMSIEQPFGSNGDGSVQ
ncbi:MAG: LON peptidase substrate-binding domain-containing protein [Anderseniella sp.]|nr:LON peptidase substrate-binding domain-containing protein [Anderseniella sp.]